MLQAQCPNKHPVPFPGLLSGDGCSVKTRSSRWAQHFNGVGSTQLAVLVLLTPGVSSWALLPGHPCKREAA